MVIWATAAYTTLAVVNTLLFKFNLCRIAKYHRYGRYICVEILEGLGNDQLGHSCLYYGRSQYTTFQVQSGLNFYLKVHNEKLGLLYGGPLGHS